MNKSQASLGLAAGIAVAFALLLTACAAPGNWWPLFTLAPVIMAPIPLVFTGMGDKYSTEVNVWASFGQCLMAFCITSVFGLPIVMTHLKIIDGVALALVLSANVVAGGTIAYFAPHLSDEDRLLG